MTGPDPLHAHEGICTCIHVGTTRVPVTTCGLSAHRVQAAAAAEVRRSRRG